MPNSFVSLVMVDIQGSTPLSKSLGGDAWLDLLTQDFNPMIASIVERRDGEEFQKQAERGDDCVKAYFSTPRDAVACAIDIQNQFKLFGLRRDDAGNEVNITLHAAVHTCPLLDRAETTPDVSQIPDLARLLKESKGGQILLSETCYAAYLKEFGSIPFRCHDSGKVKLRGIAEPQRYYTIEGYGEADVRLLGFANVVASDSYIVRRATEKQVREAFKKPYGRASETRFVTIYGEGGMGKTRLGVTCARQMSPLFPGGVAFVPLAFFNEQDPAKAAGALADTIYRALQLPAASPDQKIEDILLARLQDRPAMLLLLDNAETIATQQAAREYLQTLLNETRESQHCLLATSRKWLNIWEEGRVDVNAGLTAVEAFNLFRERARQEFALPQTTPADVSRLDDLLRKTEYRLPPLPKEQGKAEKPAFTPDEYNTLRLLRLFHLANHNTLAIELIASWTGLYLTPGELLADYEATAFSSLTETDNIPFGDENARIRHRSLEASYNWSWKNLGGEAKGAQAQAAFLSASLFDDSFSVEALQAVLGVNSKPETIRALKMMLDAALCRAETVAGATRYRMHWQLRAYGRERRFPADANSPQLPSQSDLHQHYIAYYNAAKDVYGFDNVTSSPVNRVWVDEEWRNIAAAAECADSEADFHAAVWLRLSLTSYFEIEANWRSWEELGKKAADSAKKSTIADHSHRDKAATLNNLGIVYQIQGRWQEAEEAYNESRTIQREFGDRHGEGRTLGNLGLVYRAQSRWEEAEEAFNADLAICREFGDRSGEGQTLNNLGIVYQIQGRWQEAEEAYNESRTIFREFGDRRGEGRTLNNLGIVYQARSRWQEAEEAYNESRTIFREFGDRRGEGRTLNNLGIVYQARSRWQEAEEAYNESRTIQREFGDRHGEGQTLGNLGIVYQARSRWQEAEEAFNESRTIFREFGDRHNEGQTLNNLGSVYQARSRWQEAEEAFNESLIIFREFGDRRGEGRALGNLGSVYQARSRWQEAEEAYKVDLAICREFGDRYGEGQTLGNISVLYLVQQNAGSAADYARQAVAAIEQTQDVALLQRMRDLLAHCESLMA